MEERRQFVHAILEEHRSIKEVCAEYGISRKTGYKWLDRFESGGYSGLMDQSRRPATAPHQLEESVVCDLIKEKLLHATWGPKKIRELYSRTHRGAIPSLSSVNRIFRKAGLVKRRRKRVHSGGQLTSSIQVEAPNDIWTIDFKGWWYTTDHNRFEPFTVRDAFSRYVLEARALKDNTTETVKAAFIRLFRQYGLPKVIQSDNGVPFAARSGILGISQLTAWLISLGIHIHHSRPGHPQDNGGHERMHKDLKDEVQVRYSGNTHKFQSELDIWRHEFNTVRPHEAIAMKTPSQVYRKSLRRYRDKDCEVEYPNSYQVRAVSTSGMISVQGFSIFLSTALRNFRVGLKTLDSSKYAVYFATVFLGTIDLSVLTFVPYQDEALKCNENR